jgi:putative phosphoesterase
MPKKTTYARATLRGGDTLRIVAVSDTHGRPHADLDARLREAKPDYLLHGGDVGDLAVLDRLRAHAPVTAVRGNVDGHDLPDFVTIDVQSGDDTLLRILLTHVAVYGTKLRADVARVARRDGASLVVCGHSHIPFAAHDRDITIFNPGSVGPRRFQLPIVFGILDIARTGVSVKHVDCETGQPWVPRAPPRF